MALFTIQQVNGFLQNTELDPGTLESALADSVTLPVVAALQAADYDVSSWVSDTSTPTLVQTICAMYYAAFLYDRVYSDNTEEGHANYATILRRLANLNLNGLVDGTLTLAEQPDVDARGLVLFFPTDQSSMLNTGAGCEGSMGTLDDPSNTPAAFSMGTVF